MQENARAYKRKCTEIENTINLPNMNNNNQKEESSKSKEINNNKKRTFFPDIVNEKKKDYINTSNKKKTRVIGNGNNNDVSYLDYVLSDPCINITKIQLNIDRHWMNTSDHLALLIILNIDNTPQSEITETEQESCIKREKY